MEKKLQKPYLKDYNLLRAQDLELIQRKTFLIILLNEFIKSNESMGKINNKCEQINVRD